MRRVADLLANHLIVELHRLVVVLHRGPVQAVEAEGVLGVAREGIGGVRPRHEDGLGVVVAEHAFL